jgi:hypothetical protein
MNEVCLMSKQSDYEKGVKHGLNSSDANDFMEGMGHVVLDLRSEAMRKGEEYGIEQRHKNERKAEADSKKAGQTSEHFSTSESSSNYSGSSSGSSSGYCSGSYSGSSASGGFGGLAIVGIIIAVVLALALLSPSSPTQSSSSDMGGPLYQDKGYLGNGNYRAAPKVIQGKFGNFLIAEFEVIVPYDGQYDLKVLAKKPAEKKFSKASVKHARKLGTSITIQLYEEYPQGTKFRAKFYF